MKEEICKAFCDAIRIKEVPIGLAVSTSLRRSDGDAVGFYVVRNRAEPGLAHLEDDGTTVPYLQAAGVDFETQTREKAFTQILAEYGAHYDSDEAVIRTPELLERDLPRSAIGFATLLLRLSDFLLLSQDHVESAFKDDAKKRIRDAVGERAEISENEAVSDALSDAKPDLVIRAKGRDPVAVFLAQSQQRVNDAIFLQMTALLKPQEHLAVVALLESDNSIPAKLRQRASNWLAAVPVFRNDEDQAVRRVVREAIGSHATLH